MAERIRKPAGVIIFFLTAVLCVDALAAEGRSVPVLERRGGGLYLAGRESALPAGAVTGARIFGFDRPSLRGLQRTRESSARRMLQGPAAPADTWNVILVRVSFETDRSGSLTSIRTGGGFDLTPAGTSVIDPTPHNRSYFDAHMEAMARYWDFQSCGATEITWDILPAGENGSYRLTDLADYGPGRSGQWTTEMLVKFVQDAIAVCDDSLQAEGYPVRLSDFDAIVLAHAGANLQSDVLGNSPNDIPSFYARLGDGDEIVIEGGHVITELSVIPETSIQDGYNGGIAAVLAHEFGHQLGLPDLYDTYTNFPSIGVFDNMDSGGQLGAILVDTEGGEHYAEGFIPSGLSAWSKYFLGWMEADTIGTFESAVALSASGKCPSRGVRVEMSADEYWLIENRAAELDGLYTGFVFDEVTGVILGPGNCMNCETGFPEVIDWEYTNGYDYLLPTEEPWPGPDWGPGLLVWHVDEFFIERRWETNEVNSRWPFGVSLIEANGVVDLGDPTSRFGLGWYDDAFYEGNSTEMNDSTLPPAWSNWQVQSGLRLEEVSGRDTLMTFSAGCRDRAATRMIPGGVSPSGYGVLPLAHNDALIVDEEGKGWLPGRESPVFDIGGPALTPAAVVTGFPGCGGSTAGAVMVAGTDGTIHMLSADDWSQCPSWPVMLDTLATFPVPVNSADGIRIVAAEREGLLHLLDTDGNDVGTAVSPPSCYIFSGNLVVEKNASDEAVAVYALLEPDGEGCSDVMLARFLITDIGLAPPLTVSVGISRSSSDMSGDLFLAGGDIIPDSDGAEVWIVAAATGRMLLFGNGGRISERNEGREIPYPPALQDMNGDGRLDLVYTDGSTIFTIDPSGANITGWPRDVNRVYVLPVEVSISAPLVTAASAEGAWVIAGTNAGIMYMFDHEGDLVPGWPRKTVGSFIVPIDLTSGEGHGYCSWIDIIYNSDESGFGLWRSESGRARWHITPFGDFDITASWTSVYGGADRDSWVQPSSGFEIDQPQWADLDENLVIYPNPSNGDRVAFHFTAPGEGEAKLDIMTLEGDRILEKSMPLTGGQAEFAVEMTDQASGVYLCRIVVKSGGRTVETKKKFAIVN